MYKACSRCGRIHKTGDECKRKEYRGGQEREQRSSYQWTKKSKEIRQQALFCEVCQDTGHWTYTGLEVHHIDKIKDNPDRLLEDDNLICLCREHHRQADRGDLAKEYLKSLVEKRKEKADL